MAVILVRNPVSVHTQPAHSVWLLTTIKYSASGEEIVTDARFVCDDCDFVKPCSIEDAIKYREIFLSAVTVHSQHHPKVPK